MGEGLSRNVRRLKKYTSSLVLFPLAPQGKDRKDKEKMITFLMAQRKAKIRMAKSGNFLKTPLPIRQEKKIAQVVDLEDVPNYNAFGTMKNEWCIEKHHFKWRRDSQRLATASSKISKIKRGEKKDTPPQEKEKITRRRAEFYVLTFL